MDVKKSAILTVVCLAAMFAALLFTVWVSVTYEIRFQGALRANNPITATFLGVYILVFLLANTALSTTPIRQNILVVAPAALVASLVIASGPLHAWLFHAGIVMGILTSFVLAGGSGAAVFIMLFVGPVAGPVTTGCLTGLMVHFAARIIAGQSLWDRLARREAFAHCMGFTLGAVVVFLRLISIDKDLQRPLGEDGGAFRFFEFLWPIYLAAPAAHLACLWAARYRWGWPNGAIHVKRLMAVCVILFLIVGAMRGFAAKDPKLLLTWPVRDFAAAQFWKNPKRDAPLIIGDHRILIDPKADVHRKWNREQQRYDSIQLHASGTVRPLTDGGASHVELRWRDVDRPSVPVKCGDPAPHGLLLCRPLRPQEQATPGDPTVPALWVSNNYEIYVLPEYPDILLSRRLWKLREKELSRLEFAYSEDRFPKISVQIALTDFDLARWREAADAFDQVVAHHLRPVDSQ